MLLMDEFLLGFVNNRDVFLVYVFLVNDWLNMFMDNWSMDLMDQVSVNFVYDILMMFMDYLSVGVSHDRLFNNSLNNRCFLM